MDKESKIEARKSVEETPKNGVQQKVDLLDYISILMKWKRFIFINVLAVTLLAVIVSLLLPKWYKATASILPPKQQDALGSLGGASSLLKNIAGGSRIGGLGQKNGAYNYFAILKSRSAMEAVVHKFDLISVYNINDSSMENAVKELRGNVTFDTEEDENLTVDVFDKSPQRAAAIANYFVELLNNISISLGTQEARSNREFIERRLEQSKQDLRNAEDSLRSYQEKSGFMVAPEQNSVSISGIGELYGMKARKEVELAILKKTASAENSLVQQKEIELEALDRKLSTFPEAGIASLRLFRNVVIQQRIVEYLIPLYEQAKVDEQKDVPVILVLDKAVPPEKKAKPKRLMIVAVAAGLSLLFSLIVILGNVRMETMRLNDREGYERYRKGFSELGIRSWLRGKKQISHREGGP